MATLDKMMIDDRDLANRYFGDNSLDDLTTDQFLFSKPPKTTQPDFPSKPKTKRDATKNDDDLTGLFGRRVFLESPAFDNKEEEDMYRYVPSRLSEVPPSLLEATAPTGTAAATDNLIDSLDFELNLFGAANARRGAPYRTTTQMLKESKPPVPLTQMKNPLHPSASTNTRRPDPREDPLLGPLLAELDAMTTHQSSVPMYRRNSVPYQSNLSRPPVPSHSNHVLSTTANRTVNDALFEAELYDSLDPRNSQPVHDRQHLIFSAPSITSSHHPQPPSQQQQRFPTGPLNMNNIDVFMPQSYDNGTGVFPNQFASNDQIFQQPLLNALGQNYVPNARQSAAPQQQQPIEQRDKSYDDIYSRMSPPQHTGYVPSQQPPSHKTNNPYQQQKPQQQYEQPETNYDDIYSRMSPPHRGAQVPPQQQQQQQHQQQQQQQPPVPNRQATYHNHNNNNDSNDPFSEFQDMFNAPQNRRPSQVPTQQYPPPTQQQPMMPAPPSFRQQRMPPPPPPASQQQSMMPPQPPTFQQPRMPPPAFQQPRMMPPSFPQPRMAPPPASFQQPRMPPPPPPPPQQFAQQQQQQRPYQSPPSTQQHDEYQPFPASNQQQQQYYDEEYLNANYPSNNQDMFFTDVNDDQFDQVNYQQHQPQGPSMSNQQNVDQQDDQDSKRQAVWNELQRTNAKVQEKNAKKRESANRREQLLKGTHTSTAGWTNTGNKLSSAQSKTGAHSPPARRPPPPPQAPPSKTNYIEENIDMIKNKENFYHRYPAKKYENLYSKRRDLFGGGAGGTSNEKSDQNGNQHPHGNFDQGPSTNHGTGQYSNSEHQSNLPITINLNPGNRPSNDNQPATVSIPLDSQVTRVGDKISVNIDVRLLDLQTMKQQQQQQQQNNDRPDYSGLDPLDRHIRKLENSIDQSLPPTHSPPRRSSPPPNPFGNASMGRYGKMTVGTGQGGYSPPSYKTDQFSYSAKARQEDSYLTKMTHVKKPTYYKPYTGRDFEQFKKNYSFGSGNLGFDYDNPDYKEKSDKVSKTKEYAQQIELRNKKILAEAPRRTLSETRKPSEPSQPSTTQRAQEYARVSTRHKVSIGSATQPSPPYRDEPAPLQRRPTEVPRHPPPAPRQPARTLPNDDNDLVERLALRHEHDKAQVQGIMNPSQKRREQLFDEDDRRTSDIEKLAQERAHQRRLSPAKPTPPTGILNNGNVRRPLRFDKTILPDEPTGTPQLPARSAHQQPAQPHLTPQHQQPRPQLTPQQQQPHPPPTLVQPVPQTIQYQQTVRHQPPNQQTNVDDLANRHNDEKLLMEAIRKELSERPLDDDEELVVVEQQS